jgi:membrane protease subunit (stomatin/prohibitin family)
MSLRDFLSKQFIDVIDWVEPGDGILAYRYPMQDREIQNGGKLTVRDSQMALFVNEGKVADAFSPGLYTLNTHTLPILTYIQNWDKAFQSPFKSDVYFFSTRIQTNQHWGTPNPITIRDKEFGAVRLRAFGIYTYHISDPKVFSANKTAAASVESNQSWRGRLSAIAARQSSASLSDLGCMRPTSVRKLADPRSPRSASPASRTSVANEGCSAATMARFCHRSLGPTFWVRISNFPANACLT